MCTSEVLNGPTFSCRAYKDRCAYLPGYAPYPNCDATVASNQDDVGTDNRYVPGGSAVTSGTMGCRAYHLGAAGGTVDANARFDSRQADAKIHCAHASESGDPVCTAEVLNPIDTFPCGTFDATCSTQAGYTPYDNCRKTVRDNPVTSGFSPVFNNGTVRGGEMGCRIYREYMIVFPHRLSS